MTQVATETVGPMPPEERAQSLFAIVAKMRGVLDLIDEQEGELDDAMGALLDRHAEALSLKAEAYKALCGELMSEAASLEAMADRYLQDAKRKRKHSDKLKQRMFGALEAVGLDKITGPTGGARLQNGDAVVELADDLDEDKIRELRPEYVHVKRTPNLKAIKAALKAGRTLDFAKLVTKRHLRWL